MANLAFSGPKASQKEVKKELMKVLADCWTGAFTVDIFSDGGGAIVRAGPRGRHAVSSLPQKLEG
jgi:hypothetical protein